MRCTAGTRFASASELPPYRSIVVASLTSSNTPTKWPRSKSISACHRIWRLPGPQKHHRPIPSELEAQKVLLSPESRATSTSRGSRAPSSAGTGRALATEIIVQIPAVRLHVAQSRDAHEHRLALGGGPWCHAPTAESPRPSCDRLAGDLGAMDRRLSFRPTGQRARRGRKRNRQ